MSNKQQFRIFGQIEAGKPFDVTAHGWRELQEILKDVRADGSYLETQVTVEVLA